MVVKCEKCGADNPDDAIDCSSCLGALKPPNEAAVANSTPNPRPSQPSHATPLATGEGRGGRPSMFTLATYSAAVGVILSIVSFILYVYYYERAMDPIFFRRIYDVLKVSLYSGSFGWIAVILSVILTMKGLMGHGLESAIAALRKVDLNTVVMLTIVALVFLLASALALITAYEFGEHLSEDAEEFVSRVYLYATRVATIVESALVLTIVDSLRKAPASPQSTKACGGPSKSA